MQRVIARLAGPACFAAALWLMISIVAGGVALAQTTAVNSTSAPAEASLKQDELPPGSCTPIGLTASGEIVFPFQCKDLIERERGKAVEPKPAAANERPPVTQAKAEAPDIIKPETRPVETVPLPKRIADRPRDTIPTSCPRHRAYDPASRTYLDHDGRRRPCPSSTSSLWQK